MIFLADEERERELKRMRVFRDRKNPLDWLDDVEVIERYRLPRIFLVQLVDLVRGCGETHQEKPLAFGLNPGMLIIYVHRVRSYQKLLLTYTIV